MEIKVVRQILEWNENCHDELQQFLKSKNVFMINVMGSPGAGKTTFIMKLIEELKHEYNIGVIEGDVYSTIDAQKIADAGIPVVQLNTEGACHIEALSIKHILEHFNLEELDLIIVENIGNLVCPAEFDIGENLKIALLSVPEGDDKVEKYPLMFTRANAVIITKFDMKEYFSFDEERVFRNTLSLNSEAKFFTINSLSGNGVDAFAKYLREQMSNYYGIM